MKITIYIDDDCFMTSTYTLNDKTYGGTSLGNIDDIDNPLEYLVTTTIECMEETLKYQRLFTIGLHTKW